MTIQPDSYEDIYRISLKKLLLNHAEFMQRLYYLREINPCAYLSAGVIRNLVWSVLHDQYYDLEYIEIDVIFFDTADIQQEQRLKQSLQQRFANNEWDVVNQALVHHWYQTEDGLNIAPYTSLNDALATWPETATAIAIRLIENDDLEIIAPFGLNDLFELKLRWNDRLVSRHVFMQRIISKKFLERWNQLKIV